MCSVSDSASDPKGKPPQPQLISTQGQVRADLWLWAVRQFKTRSAAAKACKAGHVQINAKNAKPASAVKVGDQLQIRISGFDRKLEVTGLLEKRTGAPTAQLCYLDQTPAPLPRLAMPTLPRRDPGSGRPTKKERRELDRLRGRSTNQDRHL